MSASSTRVTRPGLWLLAGLLLLWAAAGHGFYRLDRAHDREGHRLLAELVEHKAALAEATQGPRVIIAGGSNAYYGLDAALLEHELERPVINLALPFGGHHHTIAIDLLEDQLQEGDTVVFSGGTLWDPDRPPSRRAREFDAYLDEAGLAGYTRKFGDGAIPWRPLPQTGPLLLAAAEGFDNQSGRSWIADTDKHGTYTACVDAPVVTPRRYGQDRVNAGLVEALRRSAQRLAEDDIRVVVSLPWLFIRENDRARWIGLRDRLVANFGPEIPVLASEPQELLRSRRSDFCDSPLHLSKEASRQRTLALANSLRPLLEGE